MEKTKLGISVSLMAALLYFLGLINTLALIIAVGYVLWAEKDSWLRKAAIQSLTISVGCALFSDVLGLGNQLFALVNNFFQNFFYWFHVGYPLNMDSILLNLVGILQTVLLLVLGGMALAHKDFTLPLVGDFADKHLGLPRKVKAVAQPPVAYPYAQAPTAPVYPQAPVQAPAPETETTTQG